jgi:hypothetical protein
MKFSVIYSVDVLNGNESIQCYMPSQRHLFDTTEGDECYEYGYLADECGNESYRKGKHRKLCGILNRKQFERFLSDTGLYAESVETMGSIGAPGFGCGWAPAISFTADESSAVVNAYVTPIPEVEIKSEKSNRSESWNRIKRAVLSLWG